MINPAAFNLGAYHSIEASGHLGNLDSGVVYERHYALNWLIGYMGREWDDVTTDT
jgi:uncharacterized protein DUF4272